MPGPWPSEHRCCGPKCFTVALNIAGNLQRDIRSKVSSIPKNPKAEELEVLDASKVEVMRRR